MVVFGKLLDILSAESYGGFTLGFGLTFTRTVVFGMLSLLFLKRISEPQLEPEEKNHSIREGLSIPLKEPKFRSFLIFTHSWSFSVYFASSFFTLYFLRELRFSYGFIAALDMLSAFSDMLGMWFWGKISDRVRNKGDSRRAGSGHGPRPGRSLAQVHRSTGF